MKYGRLPPNHHDRMRLLTQMMDVPLRSASDSDQRFQVGKTCALEII